MFVSTLAQAHAGTLAYVRDQVAFTKVHYLQHSLRLVADDPSVPELSPNRLCEAALVGTAYEAYPCCRPPPHSKTKGVGRVWAATPDIPGRAARGETCNTDLCINIPIR